MAFKTETPNLEKFLAKCNALPKKLQDSIKKDINKTLTQAENLLNRNVPVSDKAPHIKDTIKRDMIGEFVGEISYGSAERPALPLEAGHKDKKSGKKVEAQPVFRPAMKNVKNTHKGRVKRNSRKIIREDL